MANNKQFYTGKYDFLGKAKYIIPTWMFIMLFGVFMIFYHGLDYGIDFAGGTEIQVQFEKPVDTEQVRKMVIELGFHKATVQSIGDKNEFLVRTDIISGKTDKETSELQTAMVNKITGGFKETFKDNNVDIRRVDSVGPQVGDELKRNSLLAAFYSLILILIYIGMRFDYKYAPAAVICLLHDAVIMVSIFAIFDREVNVQTMAAILTLIGYSLNDTIINFDRIRENERLYPDEALPGIVNRAVNDMLSRTILTHVTTEIAIVALYFLSDGVIKEIAFTLGIGIVLGTFSSIYISNPLMIWTHNLLHRQSGKMQAAKA